MQKRLIRKGLVIGIIVLFIGASVIPSISGNIGTNNIISSEPDADASRTTIYNGSLSGYVNDTYMNPIGGALVRVYFHGTYEEEYSDENGYYHVTNIPICWCYKNCTASKEGYETEWIWLSIDENTTYDFVLTPLTQYDGSLSGYVNDTSVYPIEGALVRVYFHGTYEEDYSDSTGYYHVTNIPICYCLKNCTASKEGYSTEWVLLGITENTTYDFVLEPLTDYNGSLSGYVNDTLMNPIEGARVRVYFHETYEEDYTDSSGYYHVTNIPICNCTKNATASKEGYSTEWVLLSIDENTTYDFVLTSFTEPELEITDILGGFGVTALIAARNISAETLHWSFTFDGGIILLPVGRIKEGTSHCYAESEATTFVLGVGMVDITVFVEARGEANVTKTVSGLVLGPFVIMQQE